MRLWVPSQNGFAVDPQRQSANGRSSGVGTRAGRVVQLARAHDEV
jgi:hypothetical protein